MRILLKIQISNLPALVFDAFDTLNDIIDVPL